MDLVRVRVRVRVRVGVGVIEAAVLRRYIRISYPNVRHGVFPCVACALA